jgi:hypothetical protein
MLIVLVAAPRGSAPKPSLPVRDRRRKAETRQGFGSREPVPAGRRPCRRWLLKSYRLLVWSL